jgi:predicted metalloprotease
LLKMAETKQDSPETKEAGGQRGFPSGGRILLVLVAVLLVFSVAQTFQLLSLNAAAEQQNSRVLELQGAAQTTSAAPAQADSGNSGVPSNLTNLPDMVGGC